MHKIQNTISAKLAHQIDVEEYAAVKAWIDRFNFNANHHEIADVAQQVRYMMSACIDEMTQAHSSMVHVALPQFPRPDNYLEEGALSLNRLASRMRDLAELIEGLGTILSEIASTHAVAATDDLVPA